MSESEFYMGESIDSSISTEKESDERKGFSLCHQHRFDKVGFKSLTALSAKDSLENLQKIRRRNNSSRRVFFNRVSSSERRAARKKCSRKRFDKPHVSEVNIRKVAHESEKFVSIVTPRKIIAVDNEKDKECSKDIFNEKPTSETLPDSKTSESLEASCEILHSLENLHLIDGSTEMQDFDQAKSEASGDACRDDFSLDLGYGMACSQMFDVKRRSVQWNREVDVIYYAGNSDLGKVVRRKNEPLREEAEQQARRQKFIQLAKNLLVSDVAGACQLRDPWLVVLPK